MLQARLSKELQILEHNPPPGISAWVKDDKITHFEARITGPEGTPYENGVFQLDVLIPERYPLEPPKVKFTTPIYHPNIDSGGRICLDTLNMPPKGVWRPALNIATVLTSIQQLLSEPNPDDPLMHDINDEYKYNKQRFLDTAKKWTRQYACEGAIIPASESSTTTAATTTTTTTTTTSTASTASTTPSTSSSIKTPMNKEKSLTATTNNEKEKPSTSSKVSSLLSRKRPAESNVENESEEVIDKEPKKQEKQEVKTAPAAKTKLSLLSKKSKK